MKFYAGPSYDLCTGWGTPTGQRLIDTLVPRPIAPLITNAGTSLAAEGCSPPNGAIDPGETVAVLFGLKNLGAVSTTNLVATLQADSGVLAPSGPQTYGALPGNSPSYTHRFSRAPGFQRREVELQGLRRFLHGAQFSLRTGHAVEERVHVATTRFPALRAHGVERRWTQSSNRSAMKASATEPANPE